VGKKKKEKIPTKQHSRSLYTEKPEKTRQLGVCENHLAASIQLQ